MKQKYYRRFFLLLAMLLAVTFANAQIIVEASETVELMAILSRTAGFREYCMDMGGQYTKDTEAWLPDQAVGIPPGYWTRVKVKSMDR